MQKNFEILPRTEMKKPKTDFCKPDRVPLFFSIVGAAALILVYTADWYSFEKLMIIM